VGPRLIICLDPFFRFRIDQRARRLPLDGSSLARTRARACPLTHSNSSIYSPLSYTDGVTHVLQSPPSLHSIRGEEKKGRGALPKNVFIYRGEEEEVPQKWKKKEENFFIFYLMRLRRPDSLFLFAPPPPLIRLL
jgi:hypothetical protein